MISKAAKNLVLYLEETRSGLKSTSLTPENRTLIQNIVNGMVNKYGYTREGCITLVQHLLKKRYSH
jgi:hypothetical protein